MGYQQYGIERGLVEEAKRRLKQPAVKERVKMMVEGVTKSDLENRETVARLLGQVSNAVGLPLTPPQSEAMIQFILEQRIDPANTFHLIKLWSMFR